MADAAIFRSEFPPVREASGWAGFDRPITLNPRHLIPPDAS
jgi:hypothetical protein